MVVPWQIAMTIAIGLLAALIEFAHHRRVARLGRLASRGGAPRSWTMAAIPLRGIALGSIVLGMLWLWSPASTLDQKNHAHRPSQRLVIALDVSPSMQLADTGPGGNESRAARARAVARSLLSRLGPRQISVIAVYNGARPVVVDTWDRGVVHNILGDLPLEHGFSPGPTRLFAVVEEVERLSRQWPPASTDLLIISDGDSLSDNIPQLRPVAIRRSVIIGVGDAERSSTVAARQSRQDQSSLHRLAQILGGRYVDAHRQEVPIASLAGAERSPSGPDRSRLALWLIAGGSALHALLILALARYAGAWPAITTLQTAQENRSMP